MLHEGVNVGMCPTPDNGMKRARELAQQRLRGESREYAILRAPSLDELEAAVNHLLDNSSEPWRPVAACARRAGTSVRA